MKIFKSLKNLMFSRKDEGPTHYKVELTESFGIKDSFGNRAVSLFKKLLNYFQ